MGGSAFGGVQCILDDISVLGYTVNTFVGGVKCIVGIFECIGGISSVHEGCSITIM